MKKKGLSIFQKLFIAFLGVGLIAILISVAEHYYSKKEFIRHSISSVLSEHLEASISLFERTYADPIKKDLDFIETSALLNDFLMSKHHEVLLTKPGVERLFIHFTGRAKGTHLSLRFIDSQGAERIITSGRRRARDYTSIGKFPDNTFHQRVYSLFQRLKEAKAHTMLFEGPFGYRNRLTFLAGIPKREPEIGGFGGAVIFHCDLTDYIDYLSNIKFNEIPMAWLLTPDNRVVLSPEKDGLFPEQRLYEPKEETTNSGFSVSSPLGFDLQDPQLLNIVLRIPPEVFSSELAKALRNSAVIVGGLMVLVAFLAFFLSKRLIVKPIEKLSRGAERIGGGDLDHRINIETHDEIAELADEFNRMAEGLHKSTVSRDMLVKEIAERKRAEEALRQEAQVVAQVHDSIVITD